MTAGPDWSTALAGLRQRLCNAELLAMHGDYAGAIREAVDAEPYLSQVRLSLWELREATRLKSKAKTATDWL
jgi:hypothetical protein